VLALPSLPASAPTFLNAAPRARYGLDQRAGYGRGQLPLRRAEARRPLWIACPGLSARQLRVTLERELVRAGHAREMVDVGALAQVLPPRARVETEDPFHLLRRTASNEFFLAYVACGIVPPRLTARHHLDGAVEPALAPLGDHDLLELILIEASDGHAFPQLIRRFAKRRAVEGPCARHTVQTSFPERRRISVP